MEELYKEHSALDLLTAYIKRKLAKEYPQLTTDELDSHASIFCIRRTSCLRTISRRTCKIIIMKNTPWSEQ